jgi:hypothetical protein
MAETSIVIIVLAILSFFQKDEINITIEQPKEVNEEVKKD